MIYVRLSLFMKSKTSGNICMRVWVMYLSSNNAIATVEVFAVHVHRASFALCNTSPSSCRYIKNHKTKTIREEKCASSTKLQLLIIKLPKAWKRRDSESVHTGKLSHYLLHSPSSGVGVSMSPVSSDEVVWQINGCLNTNRAGFLKAKAHIWLECTFPYHEKIWLLHKKFKY